MYDHRRPLAQRVIVIRTPDNIELSYALAGPGSRAAAYFLDLLIMVFGCQLLVNLLLGVLASILELAGGNSGLWIAAISGLLMFSLYNGYFILFEWLWNGQTPGKRLLHIRVIKEGGYALRFFDTLLRNLLRVVDFLPFFYGVGLTSLLLTRDSQRVGDLLAGTIVVYQELVETDSLLPEIAATGEGLDAPLPAMALTAIPHELMSLVSEYLRSRSELASRPRQELAAELADLIGETAGITPQPTQGVENFLVSVVRQSGQTPPWSSPLPAQADIPS
jgi:uncharacterized RDD family membrane protein YckC